MAPQTERIWAVVGVVLEFAVGEVQLEVGRRGVSVNRWM